MMLHLAAILVMTVAAVPAFAAVNPEEAIANPAALAQLQDQARQAKPRDQSYLYTELVHVMTEIAGKQLIEGDMERAGATLKEVEHYAELVHLGLAKDTKKLREAEMLMHTTTHHLGQFLHMVSSEDKAAMQSTLTHLNKLNEELLAQVFQH